MSEHTTQLPLVVTPTGAQRQFAIGRPDDDLMPRDMSWEDYYVGFSGYFGSHGPHIFAAAPELFDALKALMSELPNYMAKSEAVAAARAALAKAEGGQP